MQYIKWQSRLNLKNFVRVVLLTGLSTISSSILPTSAQSVSQTYSLWCNSAKPINSVPDSNASPVELGVKIIPQVDGEIPVIRVYRSVPNDSGYTGSIWSEIGELLGSAKVIEGQGPTPGWQTIHIYPPVSVKAGQAYIVSYHAANGQYPIDEKYFEDAVKTKFLVVPRDTVDSHSSFYKYTNIPGTFPTESYNATNYWIDVVFKPAVPQ
jgi:Domain of unknown function (DUF4082)